MDVEDERHVLCSCPACSDVRQKYACPFKQAFSVSDFTDSVPNVCGGFEKVFNIGNLLYPSDTSFSATCDVFCLLGPCWSPGHENMKALN